MKHYEVGDIVFPLDIEDAPPLFGFIVSGVNHREQSVLIDKEWQPMSWFRWAGSIQLVKHRIAWQNQYSKVLMARTFYSDERKHEVVASAIQIRNNLQRILEYFQST